MWLMIIVKASQDSEAGKLPSQEFLEAMGKYNEELVEAGILLAGEGLQPRSKGARVRFKGDECLVTDGPFAETRELIAGYWLWEVASLVSRRQPVGPARDRGPFGFHGCGTGQSAQAAVRKCSQA